MTVDTTLFPFTDLTGGNAQIRSGHLTGPASYVTGGDSVNLGDDLKMSEVWVFLAEPPSNGVDLRLVRYDYTNNKLKWFDLAGAEIAGGTNLAAYSARFFVTGK